ncbi:MAG TPA: hypothetical protein VN764_11045, partial [Polyangiaceae bacterium]|nr:hypothetical protein [Polyangiaceae bacterium]
GRGGRAISWEQLRDIEQVNGEYARDERQAPVACPNDGEPLEDGPDGELHCRYDGWIYSSAFPTS